jgi:hypothetical protein
MQLEQARTFRFSVGQWTLWLALVALAGLVAGVAVLLPIRPAFRPGTMLTLGGLPLLLLIHASMVKSNGRLLGPLNKIFFFDTVDLLTTVGLLFGIAVAAGFTKPLTERGAAQQRPPNEEGGSGVLPDSVQPGAEG